MGDVEDSWSLGKQRHKELSDSAAREYDQIYASSNFATGSYMSYELEVIERAIDLLNPKRRGIALDLGCGTGRDSFFFHRHFIQVRGFDFSTEMIRVAQQKKLNKTAGNIQFILRDLEKDLLSDIENSSVSFVSSGFGMGSFLQELAPLLKEVRRILEPSGIFVVSFYNSESLVVQLDNLAWTPSLSARFDKNTGFLRVNFKDENFDVAVRAYSLREAMELLSNYFEVMEISTFPTLSSLFPNSFFSSDKAKELCTIVDRELRFNTQIVGGPYIVAICRRRGTPSVEPEQLGYKNILRLLEANRIVPNIKSHQPVMTTDDVSMVLGVPKSELVKSILIKLESMTIKSSSLDKRNIYYVIALQAHRRMDFAKIAHLLSIERRRIRIASSYEVEEFTGFSIGGIPPFGYPRYINTIFDDRIKELDMVYCGTGKRTESLRIKVSDIIKLASPVIADISKE